MNVYQAHQRVFTLKPAGGRSDRKISQSTIDRQKAAFFERGGEVEVHEARTDIPIKVRTMQAQSIAY